jgi:hypothetical protein
MGVPFPGLGDILSEPLQYIEVMPRQAQGMRTHGLVGNVAHAESFTPWKRRFVPRADRVAVEGVGQGLLLCPVESLDQVEVGGFEYQLRLKLSPLDCARPVAASTAATKHINAFRINRTSPSIKKAPETHPRVAAQTPRFQLGIELCRRRIVSGNLSDVCSAMRAVGWQGSASLRRDTRLRGAVYIQSRPGGQISCPATPKRAMLHSSIELISWNAACIIDLFLQEHQFDDGMK